VPVSQRDLQRFQQRLESGIRDAEGVGRGGEDRRLVAHRAQVDERGAIAAGALDGGGHAERQTRLADPARAGQGDESHAVTREQYAQQRELGRAANQLRGWF
jgi:hypothetical protein